MRHIFFCLFLPFSVALIGQNTLAADSKSQSPVENMTSKQGESFYKTAFRLFQDELNLIERIRTAISEPDPNQVRAVRGQLILHNLAVERFLQRQYKETSALCSGLPAIHDLTKSQVQIYCSIHASSQELLKLTPLLDRLLSRRGELALVQELPLVSGERKSHPVLSITRTERPDLGKPATPFSTLEPNLESSPTQPTMIGRTIKTPLANYQPPIEPALAPPQEALTTLSAALTYLVQAEPVFPAGTHFQNPTQTAAALDRFAYDIDALEPQTYAKFLEMPNTGIFRVLPFSAYHRPLNTLQNRLHKSVSQRYPFPNLGEVMGGFTPSLALAIANDNFQLLLFGLDYGFMVDLGDVPIENLDASLQAVSPPMQKFFLNYQPPKQLNALQIERRRFLTGKDQHYNISSVVLASSRIVLNHSYLVRSLQFQLPEIISRGKPISPQERRQLDKLLEMHSSDIILTFRPVRRRADGSYTVLWRVLNRLSAPQIEDLEEYVKY